MNKEEKYRKNMKCLDRWLTNNEKGKQISSYLNAYQIHRIGIYGYGILGKHLVRELIEQKFPISWVIDRSAYTDDICPSLVRPDALGQLEDVDAAIITSLTEVEEIEAILLDFVTGKIISVEELIDSIYVWGNQS